MAERIQILDCIVRQGVRLNLQADRLGTLYYRISSFVQTFRSDFPFVYRGVALICPGSVLRLTSYVASVDSIAFISEVQRNGYIER